MANNSLTKTYEDLPKIVKILLQLILGAIVGGIYRILRYTETKNTTTLIVGVLAIIPPISFIFWVLDLVTEITGNRISVLAD
ncbi:MAG: hypothetical protein IIY01_03150 [Clostridia bacterium]|nr:hypothetical protein [Clostridia bacterium]MBQ2248589.1 hypothetical protein [Clostridia bacterium]MBQ5612851.1 hypothetical protein [Clostridia bacterium]MBQ5772247.1 hypothetical protein [Clostridia bacterium]